MAETLACKDCEKYITSYFANELEDEEILRLFDHISTCDECKEEFLVQHLVTISLSNTDDLEDLNSEHEIESKKKGIYRRMYKNDIAERAYLGFVYLGVAIFVLALLLIIL